MKHFALLLVLLTGCGQVLQPSATPTAREAAMAYAASTLAMFTEGDSPTPGPTPPEPVPPLPNRICDNCGGDGEVGDGTIVIKCSVCDGTGRITDAQLVAYQAKRLAEVNQSLRKAIEDSDRKFIEQCEWFKAEIKRQNEQRDNIENRLKAAEAKLSKPKQVTAKVAAPNVVGARVSWLDSGDAAKAMAAETGKPVLVWFTMRGCVWCDRVERQCFEDGEVAKFINDNFVPVKFWAEGQSRETLKGWQVDGYPSFRVIRHDWDGWTKLEMTLQPSKWIEQLDGAVKWDTLPKSQRVKARTSSYYPPVEVDYDGETIFTRRVYYDDGACSGGSCYGGSCSSGYGGYMMGGSCASGNCGGW